jgi:NADPH:quinone reductase-like Zn-dependent oxidoreductase
MTEMRAMVIEQTGGPEALRAAAIPRPKQAIGELIVKVTAAGVNPIDAKTRAGRGAAPLIQSWPVVLGVDVAGVVETPAYDTHPLQPGDEVFGIIPVPRASGSYAEYVAVPSTAVARRPQTLSLTHAAALPCAALTAWGAVVDVGKVKRGDRVLIHAGAGGVGHLAVQLAHHAGAHVITTASQRNADWLMELGADQVIDYTSTRFEEDTHGIDVVIDLIGNVKDDTGSRSLSVLRPGGLIINVPTASWPTYREEAEALGMRASNLRAIPDGRTLEAIAAMIDAGDLRVFVEREFPLEEAADAHRVIEAGHTRGKVVLIV